MTTPSRIRRRRTKGWRKPPGTKCVTRPGPWGNPFAVGRRGDPRAHAEAVETFRRWLLLPVQAGLVTRARRELRGFHLACWCAPGLACHADFWLRVANADGEELRADQEGGSGS